VVHPSQHVSGQQPDFWCAEYASMVKAVQASVTVKLTKELLLLLQLMIEVLKGGTTHGSLDRLEERQSVVDDCIN
jgi:hypothetical protein